MLVDNIEQLKPFLIFPDKDDTFYLLEIFKRRKDNPSMDVGSKHIKSYFLYEDNLNEKIERAIEKCNEHKARAYIRMTPRSSRKTALYNLRRLAEQIEQGNYRAAAGSYESAVGNTPTGEKRWVVDIDKENLEYIDKLVEMINSIEPVIEDRVLTIVNTVSGKHVITKPFNLMKFQTMVNYRIHLQLFPESVRSVTDVHKDSGTLLYY